MTTNLTSPAKTLIFNIILMIIGSLTAITSYYFFDIIDERSRLCEEDEFIISEWTECNDQGFQTRTATPLVNCKISSDYLLSKTCTPSSKNVHLFKAGVKEYSTKVNPNNFENPYTENRDNVQIRTSGEFATATLHVKAETTIFDGRPYKIPEFYYLFFAMNDEPLRVLGTSRVKDNRLDLNDYGIFQGTETPKELTFNLEEVKLANPSGAKLGFQTGSYVSRFLNSNSGALIDLTLFIGDGRSMIEPDELKRIYGTITDAYIEYTCTSDKICEIKRVPELPIE